MGTKPEQLGPSNKRNALPWQMQLILPVEPSPPRLKSILSFFTTAVPSERPAQVIYDSLTGSFTVVDTDDQIRLWKRGFFGKGLLSRSEPTWRQRVENKIALSEGRDQNLTAEEITARRRIERGRTKRLKKAEREHASLTAANASKGLAPPPPLEEYLAQEVPEEEPDEAEVKEPEERPPSWHLDAERTQLQPEEAFFLLFGLGCVEVRRGSSMFEPVAVEDGAPLSILDVWSLLLTPPVWAQPSDPVLSWDHPFLLSFVTYMHYRALGWVTRSGAKFCVDWVLYGPGGPPGGHAEFAVVVKPHYTDPEDKRQGGAAGENKDDWNWFSTVNRVCAGVKKTLILAHVVIPPFKDLPPPEEILKDPAQAITRFEVREVVVRRWLPGRTRD